MEGNNSETNNKLCGECRDFLYEDMSGYGICSRDHGRRSCSERYIQMINLEKVFKIKYNVSKS